MRRRAPTVQELLLEDEVQAQIVDGLRLLRYTVLVTSARSFKAGENGKGYGADKGVPDLLVTSAEWPPNVWVGIEVKRPHGWRYTCAEQRELHEKGFIDVATDISEALTILYRVRKAVAPGV